jgi:hypothetical protein
MQKRNLAIINLSDPLKPKLDFLSKKAFIDDLKDFNDKDRVWIVVEKYYPKRSLKQNNLLHLYLSEIAKETGAQLEQIKDALKKKFLSVPLTTKDGEIVADKSSGEVLERVRGTSELTVVEFMEFTENVRIWAAEFLGIYLALPEEQVELNFRNHN